MLIQIFAAQTIQSINLLDFGSSLKMFQHCTLEIITAQTQTYSNIISKFSPYQKHPKVFEIQPLPYPIILWKYKYTRPNWFQSAALLFFNGITVDDYIYEYNSFRTHTQYYPLPRQTCHVQIYIGPPQCQSWYPNSDTALNAIRGSRVVKLNPEALGVFPNQITNLAANNFDFNSNDERATSVKHNWYFIHVTKNAVTVKSSPHSDLLFSIDYLGYINTNYGNIATNLLFTLKLDPNLNKWTVSVNATYIVKFISPEYEAVERQKTDCKFKADENGIPISMPDNVSLLSQMKCIFWLPYMINTKSEVHEFN